MSAKPITCVAIGDGFVGKTTLLSRLCQKEYEGEYEPTVFDNHLINVVHDGQTHEIILIDTAGQEDFNLLRKQCYESANVFLICFNVSRADSFSNVKEQWLSEIEECTTASRILVGTKSDLRDDPETIDKLNATGGIFVTEAVARNFAGSHNMKYVECSSKTQVNIQEVLKTIMEVYSAQTLKTKEISSSSCCCVHPMLRLAKRAFCCRTNY